VTATRVPIPKPWTRPARRTERDQARPSANAENDGDRHRSSQELLPDSEGACDETRHHLYLDDALTEELEKLAAKPGSSKSAIVSDRCAPISRAAARRSSTISSRCGSTAYGQLTASSATLRS